MTRNPFKRERRQRERRKIFVVATEGEKTEEIYFAVFNNDEFRKNVQVKVLSTRKGKSAPKQVLDRLKKHARDYGIDANDELWVVVDVDSWGKQALNDLCQQCANLGFGVAVSNPCFELWLVLHQENPCTPPVRQDCERELKRMLGDFEKSKYNVEKLMPYISHAVNHGRNLDRNQRYLWPPSTGSHVYKLVAKLLEE